MDKERTDSPDGYSLLATAGWFAAGGAVTSVFSGSLAALTSRAGIVEVLTVGMVVPTFTWAVQLAASGIFMSAGQRRLYWGDLGRVCLLGSFALLPAAIVNLTIQEAPRWVTAANVLVSVVLMGGYLFHRSKRHGTAWGWPLSWCLTITVNMMLFLLTSWWWWQT